ncbi:hypothetical protein MOP88_17080 [Sphingomonas sp. WKB10]|nr:hypothetical protein [Sphingomonas sp. WKB10]
MARQRGGVGEHPLDHGAPGNAARQREAAQLCEAIDRKPVRNDDLGALQRAMELVVLPRQRDVLDVGRDEDAQAFVYAARRLQHVLRRAVFIEIPDTHAQNRLTQAAFHP